MAKRFPTAEEREGEAGRRIQPDPEAIGDPCSDAAAIPRPKREAGLPGKRKADAGVNDGSPPDPREATKLPDGELVVDDSDKHSKVKNVTTWIVSDPSPSPVPGPRRKSPFKPPDAGPAADVARGDDASPIETPISPRADADKNDAAAHPRRPSPDGSPATIPEETIYREMAVGFFSGLPDDPGRQLAVVADRIDAFRQQAIRHLQGATNTFLQAQQPETFRDKQSLVETINSHLQKIGASIRYKGQACNLIATISGGSPSGRFCLVPTGSKIPLLTRVTLADILPLELIESPRRFASRER